MANIVVSALSTFNNKGLKKGKKEISAFEKQVKTFGRTFAAAFSVTTLTRFGKEAVKAFVADEKAAKSLEQQLKNTGYQFSSPAVELYIANLQKTTGVLDDQLRPAFQQLLTVTGSITMSQDALNTAMNVSAATGASLSQVTTALSRAYAGNTTGLSRLGAGLDKALLKAGDMDAIMAKLNEKFSGQSSARLETYAGKMDLLKVASENAKEEIGKGILDALALLGKDKGIETATGQMEDFGTSIGNAIYGMGKLIDKVNDLGVVSKAGGLGNILLALQPGGLQTKLLLSSLSSSGARPRELPANEQRSAGRIYAQQFRTEVRQKKEMEKLRAQELAALKKKTAVDELKDKFDVERIGLTVALNEATDKETKLRIQAQLAILGNNEALAKKILAEMEAAKAAQELTEAFRKAIRDLLDNVKPSVDKLKELSMGALRTETRMILDYAAPAVSGLQQLIAPTQPGTFEDLRGSISGLLEQSRPSVTGLQELLAGIQRTSSPTINLTVDASGDKLSQAIAESIQLAGRNGYSTVPAGFIV
jgi:hypothetical protein